MNIKEATTHIKNTLIAYFEKDENGEYLIPVPKQRPVFLYGPPGIGKTAVMEQIAEEMGIGIVSYSMTHHTRQSAIGLPFITQKKFGDMQYDVSEYTMSEILASVYDYIENTGKKQGILFLDEINCVSETLSPSMLRFLQYKSFGSHTVPDGWVVVTAGNPPEYNKSVREYDIATLDRIKKIEVDASYNVWREYALNQEIHPAILSYLDIRNNDFYIIENTPDGKHFVTARGWEDLSRMIIAFENKNIVVDISLIEQYIQHDTVAADFADYYDTFRALRDSFSPNDILNGVFNDAVKSDIHNATASVKLGLINLLSASVCTRLGRITEENAEIKKRAEIIKGRVESDNNDIEKLKSDISTLKEKTVSAQNAIRNASIFMNTFFGTSPETSIFVSNIINNKKSATFLMSFGCEEFEKISNTK